MRITITQEIRVKQLKELVEFLRYYSGIFSYEEMLKRVVQSQMTNTYNKSNWDFHFMTGTYQNNLYVKVIEKKSKVAEVFLIDETLYNYLTN